MMPPLRPITDGEFDVLLVEMEMEFRFVQGKDEREIADDLGIPEQHVAKYKLDYLARLQALEKQEFSADVFPGLVDEELA